MSTRFDRYQPISVQCNELLEGTPNHLDQVIDSERQLCTTTGLSTDYQKLNVGASSSPLLRVIYLPTPQSKQKVPSLPIIQSNEQVSPHRLHCSRPYCPYPPDPFHPTAKAKTTKLPVLPFPSLQPNIKP